MTYNSSRLATGVDLSAGIVAITVTRRAINSAQVTPRRNLSRLVCLYTARAERQGENNVTEVWWGGEVSLMSHKHTHYVDLDLEVLLQRMVFLWFV